MKPVVAFLVGDFFELIVSDIVVIVVTVVVDGIGDVKVFVVGSLVVVVSWVVDAIVDICVLVDAFSMVAVDGLILVVVVGLSRKYQIMAETVVDSNMDVLKTIH